MKPRQQTEREGTCNKKKLPYVLSKQQLLQLLLVIKDKRYAMLVFMGCFQGLRIGEMLRLKWADVDLEHGELKVIDGKNTKRYKSNYGKDRIVPINDMFLHVWKQWRAMNEDETFVIPVKTANKRESPGEIRSLSRPFQRRFTEYLEEARLLEIDYYQENGEPRYKYHLHTLRHVCGTNLRRAGLGIDYVQDFLGHEDIESTKLYLQLAKDDLREVSHLAYAYPKSRIGSPQALIQPIEIALDKETLRLQKEILEKKLQLAQLQQVVEVHS
ncbi:site-specific integrase [Candidatus Woesearchaeota archaeon]|nr:site-specific integrase [Candidatus Woesearchaeota archaeon]